MNNLKTMAVIGLGYVGLPLALSFAKKMKVIGIDSNESRIENLKNSKDLTNEVTALDFENSDIIFTTDNKQISKAEYIIVTVPTPVDENNNPDLENIVNATKTIGSNMQKGSVIIYESTVYPGLTEEVCIPLLEEYSNMKCGKDFKIGYSPERANTGDQIHRFNNTAKVVSGIDEETTNILEQLYSLVITAPIYKAKSIKIAEASKIIENTQRDINIAFMNEASIIFNEMGIDTNDVLEAANTKWNFLNFKPGLVGGHCIGVDPYYLSYKSKKLGIEAKVINTSREINNSMSTYISKKILNKLSEKSSDLKNVKVIVKGITFKENVPDIRNSKAIEIVNELSNNNINVVIEDIYANKEDVKKQYGLDIVDENTQADAVVFAVAHDKYKAMRPEDIKKQLKQDSNLVFDIKGMFNKQELTDNGLDVWRL